jgi:hypothetical protein
MHRTNWDRRLDLRGLVLWHESSLKMNKAACLESWLGDVLTIEAFSECAPPPHAAFKATNAQTAASKAADPARLVTEASAGWASHSSRGL